MQALFLPRRTAVYQTKLRPLGGGLGRREWVLSRSLCSSERFDLSQLPSARRADALAIKLESARPYPDANAWIGWQGGVAQVWFWSPAQLPSADYTRGIIIPETTLHPPGEGLRLVRCLEGVEGQYWQQGQLLRSRWWPSIPNEHAWANFCRALGQLPGPMPEPVQLPWLNRPWARNMSLSASRLLRREKELVTATGALLSLALGWQLAGLVGTASAESEQQQRLNAIRQEAGPELEARNRAMNDLDTIRFYTTLGGSVSQQRLMADVADAMPQKAQLVEWRYIRGEPLRFTLRIAGEVDNVAMIRRFEALDRLQEVSAQRGSRGTDFDVTARIVGEGQP